MLKKLLVIGASLFFINACSTQHLIKAREIDEANAKFRATLPSPNANYGSPPKNYKKLIRDYMSKQLKDPDSAKYSNFSIPRKEHIIHKTGRYITENDVYYGYSACVQVNAKNSYGGYTGNEPYWFFFYKNQIMRVKKISSEFGSSIYIGRNVNCQDG